MKYVPTRTARAIVYCNAVAAATLIALGGAQRVSRHHQIDEMIIQHSNAHHLDPRFVASVAWRESRFKPTAVSKTGAIGVMQISREVGLDWARSHKVRNYQQNMLFLPEVNIRVGTWNLARLMRRWSHKDDPLPYVLASYVAGPGNADRWDDAAISGHARFEDCITYPVARGYIRDILKRYRGRV